MAAPMEEVPVANHFEQALLETTTDGVPTDLVRHKRRNEDDDEGDGSAGAPPRKKARITDMHPDDLLRKTLVSELGRQFGAPSLGPTSSEISIIAGGKHTSEAALSDAYVEVLLYHSSGRPAAASADTLSTALTGPERDVYNLWMTPENLYAQNKDENELHSAISQRDIFTAGMATLAVEEECCAAPAALALKEGAEMTRAYNCRAGASLHVAVHKCNTPATVVDLLSGASEVECDAPCVELINQWTMGLAERVGVQLVFLPPTASAALDDSGAYIDYAATLANWERDADKWAAAHQQGLVPDRWSIPLGFNSSTLPVSLDAWVEDPLNARSGYVATDSQQLRAQNRAAWRLRYQRDMIDLVGRITRRPVITGSGFACFAGGTSGASVPPLAALGNGPLAASIRSAGLSGQLYYLGYMTVRLALFVLGRARGAQYLHEAITTMPQKDVIETAFMALHDLWAARPGEPVWGPIDDLSLMCALVNGNIDGVPNLAKCRLAHVAATKCMFDMLRLHGAEFGSVAMAAVTKIVPQETYYTDAKFGKSLAEMVAHMDGGPGAPAVPCEHTDALRALQLAVLQEPRVREAYPQLAAACVMKSGYLVADPSGRMNVLKEALPSADTETAAALAGVVCVEWPYSSLPVQAWTDVMWDLVAARAALSH